MSNLNDPSLLLNTGLISNEIAPFGGMKQSGGKGGVEVWMDDYLVIKYICFGWE